MRQWTCEPPRIATADKWDRCLCREFSQNLLSWPFPWATGHCILRKIAAPEWCQPAATPGFHNECDNSKSLARLPCYKGPTSHSSHSHLYHSFFWCCSIECQSVYDSLIKDHSLSLLDFNSAGRNLLELFASQLPMAPICHQQNFIWSICSKRREKTQAAVPGVLRPGGQERGRRIEEVSVHLIMPTYYSSVSLCLLDLAYSNCTCYCHDIQYCQRYAIEDLYDRTQKCHPMQKLSCNILHVSSETN